MTENQAISRFGTFSAMKVPDGEEVGASTSPAERSDRSSCGSLGRATSPGSPTAESEHGPSLSRKPSNVLEAHDVLESALAGKCAELATEEEMAMLRSIWEEMGER
ncbi:hypothetical protein [Nocardioides sp. YR527]|uniref:hypothetical protein n=1 Tax=Nocardioides sp. YR527 TaxID=1881028 RepID=UPI00115F7FC1|nr:hypothetical protein [Nocardioides sp. YR527]